MILKSPYKVGDLIKFNSVSDHRTFVVYAVPVQTQVNIALYGDNKKMTTLMQNIHIDDIQPVVQTDLERLKKAFDQMGRKYKIRELPDYNLIQLIPERTVTVLEFRLSDGDFLG